MPRLHQVNTRRLIRTFMDLVRLNSPSFSEGDMGRALGILLKERGCSVRLQDYGDSFNLIAFKKGSRAGALPLLLSGHMDTVEPTEGIAIHQDDTVIRSSGATVLGADDKAAIAQILEAVYVLHEGGMPHGDIELVFTSAEERGLTGARRLDFGSLRSRHAIVMDASGQVGSIVVGAPTHVTYEMTITGKSAHAGIEPEKGISAVRAAGRIVSEVPDGRIDPVTTANVGLISGGTATNVVSKEAVIRGEVRSHDAAALSATREAIFSAARKIAAEIGVKIQINEHEEYRAFRIPDHDPFLAFLTGVYRRCGIEPSVTISGGGSDANIFNLQGMTAINLSTGMQKVHSSEEFIMVEDLIKGASVVLQAVTDFADFRTAGPAVQQLRATRTKPL